MAGAPSEQAGTVGNVLQILGDPVLRRVVTTTLGLPLEIATLWVGALLILLAFLVLYPLTMLVFGALSDSNPVVDGFGKFKPSLAHFAAVLKNENVHLAFFNALAACGGDAAAAAVVLRNIDGSAAVAGRQARALAAAAPPVAWSTSRPARAPTNITVKPAWRSPPAR